MGNALEICHKLESKIQRDNPVHVSFYNYCKHYLSPAESIQLQTIDAYFRRLYAFEFWRKEDIHLQTEIKKLLISILPDESLKEILKSNFFHQCQLITLKQKRDFLAIAKTYANQKSIPYNIIDTDPGILYIHYQGSEHNHILQKMYPHCFVNNGNLYPIINDELIYFDQHIELQAFQAQHIQLNDFTYLRLEKGMQSIQAQVFKGYSLQASKPLALLSLNDNSKIYYAVKRYESLITGKNDNRMYQGLCDLLEKSLDLLKAGHPEAVKLAFVALERGKNAQQTTFPNDKLLQVLIKELSFHLNSKVERTATDVSAFE